MSLIHLSGRVLHRELRGDELMAGRGSGSTKFIFWGALKLLETAYAVERRFRDTTRHEGSTRQSTAGTVDRVTRTDTKKALNDLRRSRGSAHGVLRRHVSQLVLVADRIVVDVSSDHCPFLPISRTNVLCPFICWRYAMSKKQHSDPHHCHIGTEAQLKGLLWLVVPRFQVDLLLFTTTFLPPCAGGVRPSFLEFRTLLLIVVLLCIVYTYFTLLPCSFA